MNQSKLDLSTLSEFVFGILRSTDEVKNILNTQCDEAKFVLKPWPLETILRKELDPESCTCTKIVSSEDHVNEIARGIDKAIAQARQLREKLAINVLEEKKLARRPSVRQIYAPTLKESGSKTKPVKSNMGKENGGIDGIAKKSFGSEDSQTENNQTNKTHSPGQKKQLASGNGHSCLKKNLPVQENSKILNTKAKSKVGRLRSVEKNKKSIIEICLPQKNAKKSVESKKIVDKKLIGTSPYNSLAIASEANRKSKVKKNFIAANKSSIKSMKTAYSKSSVSSSQTNELLRKSIHNSETSATIKSSNSSLSGPSSAAELEQLISKISVESDNGVLNSGINLEGKGCPVHDSNAPKYIEEKIYTSLDVTEGLDHFGVPSELVKILKVYHNYLNSQSMEKSNNKRNEKAVHRFLSEFQNMNRERQKLSTSNELENLCKDFLPMLTESCNKKMDFIEMSKLKVRYTDLDSRCKLLDIRSFSPTKRKMSNIIENRCEKSLLEQIKPWRINAVWNEASIPSLKSLEGMSDIRCIRYSNRNQLLTLFDFMQQIQQLKYQANLVDLLINEVVPSVQDSLVSTSEEYVEAYKMITIISNLLHLRVPVIVRTDK